jgi:hypothetical protein
LVDGVLADCDLMDLDDSLVDALAEDVAGLDAR